MKRSSDSAVMRSTSVVFGGALVASLATALFLGGLALGMACVEDSPKAASTKEAGSTTETGSTTEKGARRKLIEVDKKAQKISVATVAAKQNVYEQLKGAIEYVLVCKGGKEYETLFTTECEPKALNAAFHELQLYVGRPAGTASTPWGVAFRIFAEYEEAGKKKRRAVDEFVIHSGRGKPLEMGTWVFTGSVEARDPATKRDVLQCLVTKHLVGLHFGDSSPLFQNSRAEARQENIYKTEMSRLPKEGTPVKLVFERVRGKVSEGAKRAHVFMSGRVQGVGFRAFTQRAARRLKLAGFVRNLKDGRVEAVIEGPREAIEQLMEKLKRGPRSARVDALEREDVPPMGDFESFRVER